MAGLLGRTRDNGPADGGPLSKDDCGVLVRVRFKPALQTKEFRLRFPVSFVRILAPGAFPAGVPGVDEDDRNPGQKGLVHDERTELGKRPAVHPRPGLFAEPVPVADPLEVFQGDPASGALGTFDEGFGNAMIYVFHVPGFFPGQVF